VCDGTAPSLVGVPANIDCVEATSAAGAVVTYTMPTATDSVDGAAVVPVCTPASGSTFALGLTTVTCTATDSHGNRARATFTVRVCDRTPPKINNTPANIPCVEATSAAGAAVTFTTPTATDVVSGTVTVMCVKGSGSVFALGTTTVVCTATDAAGNSASSSFIVEVCDKKPPTITGTPANITCQEATSAAGRVVTYTNPTATDLVDGAVTVVCVLPSGSTFPLGTTTVSCRAIDCRGNAATTSFTITVCDKTPPTIRNTPSNIPCVEATSAAGAVVSYTAPTASDLVSGTVTVTCVKASGSTFALGTTTVVCTSSDAAGNTATSSFTVQVLACSSLFLALSWM
jgi:hypothetical protein